MRNTHSSQRFIHTNYLARQRVKRTSAGSHKLSLMMVGIGLTVLAGLFMFLWVRIYVLEIGYEMSKSMDLHDRLVQKNRALRIERASLISPSRIEKIAKNKLGMVVPDSNQVVTLQW